MTIRTTAMCNKWTMLAAAIVPFLVACQTVEPQSGVAEQQVSVIAVKDIPVDVLGKDAKGQAIIAYFGAPDTEQEGESFAQAQQDGFYRIYAGKNSAGQHVIQDFYQANGAAQTSPFFVDPVGNVLDWAVLPQDGKITFYRPNGAVRGVTAYRDGMLDGQDIYYNDDGSERSVYTWKNDLLDGPFFAKDPDSKSQVEGVAKEDAVVSIKANDDSGQVLTKDEAERLLEASMLYWYQDIFK
ncbi:hypothetical protein E9531_12625 [Lampropedia puyangensis]|uniref:Lipoprotein n=1 Tax=Lampropedia puyangensis TaxID=1330072 RepID=A0A4S8EY86_9BURK|nr:hypothetical protein [Lampropedia puyangensis]THT99240.1 hypothetical protein E9531_12625 [Lampropedia puyangensis]